ncbi:MULTISPECIES: glutathione S-transferase family protein [unclassified Psychrobacter]|uniref:Glutathione S-transferase family protein n=1 Tax=Psychrobacter proteolyticus TaxID=147825 RepID=A0ABV0D2L5_9GAMM|nr:MULTISPECIES: glutathione S-transferase family protein [unclassified Psychrobacter]MCG3858981.1 glutathione S-transferase family protein [Psychrobacter sp. Ps2]NYR10352.1 glutathione S-transferase family protein [Psychrobacter sp. BI730]
MITLHGFAASNYYNIVKHALLYKGIPFQEDLLYAGSDDLLTVSPVGKVPAITMPDGFNLSESNVICDFLEETYPEKPLYPTDAAERATVRQIMKIAELYFELPSRRLIPYVFSGTQAPNAVKEEVRQVLGRGIIAMNRLCQFSPWIAGEQFTMADIYVHHVNTIVNAFGATQLEWDVLAEVDGMKEWNKAMSETDIAKSVQADSQANMPEFMQHVKALIQAANAK